MTQLQLPQKFQKKRIIVPILTGITFLLFGIFSIFYSFYYQSTDDAFIEGKVVSIAPKVSGEIVELYVDDNDYVKEGQIIAQIDKRDYEVKVEQAKANLEEAIAELDVRKSEIEKSKANLDQANQNLVSNKSKLDFAIKDYNRYNSLNKYGICTKQEHESSIKNHDVATANYKESQDKTRAYQALVKNSQSQHQVTQAKIDKLKAELEQAKLNLEYTTIIAPQEGCVSSRSVEKGNYVQIAQPLMTLVSSKVWVIANFKETQITNMKKGQPVNIKIDTYPHKKFKGQIDSIQKASGAKASLFPPENAVGSYVKIVQRIPVKITFTEDYSNYNIAPGMSVVPTVKVK